MTNSQHVNPYFMGTWLSLGSPVVAELASLCGFDWLLFDLEHGCGSEADLLSNLQATRCTSLVRIVRVGAVRPELISRVLDWGADGIMVPRVSSPEQAAACAEAAHYAPRGHRGFARSVREYDYGLHPPIDAVPGPLILAQIESAEAVEHAQAIAEVDGIDALFIGPSDLRFDLKTRSSTYCYDECLTAVTSAAARAGKQSGILLPSWDDAPHLLSLGMTWLAVGSDIAVLRDGFRRIVDRSRRSRLMCVTDASTDANHESNQQLT